MPIELDIQRHILTWEANNGERLTRKLLARRLGVSLPTVYRMLGRASHVNLDILDKMCELFNCQPADILKRIEN